MTPNGEEVQAHDLEEGEAVWLLSERGDGTVVHVDTLGRRQLTVFNLTVANKHTFFVGEQGVWVHNQDIGQIVDTIADRAGRQFANSARGATVAAGGYTQGGKTIGYIGTSRQPSHLTKSDHITDPQKLAHGFDSVEVRLANDRLGHGEIEIMDHIDRDNARVGAMRSVTVRNDQRGLRTANRRACQGCVNRIAQNLGATDSHGRTNMNDLELRSVVRSGSENGLIPDNTAYNPCP